MAIGGRPLWWVWWYGGSINSYGGMVGQVVAMVCQLVAIGGMGTSHVRYVNQ